MTDKEEDRGKIIESLVTRLESRLIEVERLRALTNWQPIETAPRDGTHILGWVPSAYNGMVPFGEQQAPPDEWYCTSLYWHQDDTFPGVCGWRLSECGFENYNDECSPTHWMPLPEPPGA